MKKVRFSGKSKFSGMFMDTISFFVGVGVRRKPHTKDKQDKSHPSWRIMTGSVLGKYMNFWQRSSGTLEERRFPLVEPSKLERTRNKKSRD